MFVTALAGIVAYGSVLAPPVTIDIPLKLVKAKTSDVQYVGQSFYGMSKGTSYLRGYTIPASMGATHSVLMYMGNRELAIVAAKDPKANRFSKIWVDFDGNKKFDSNELAVYEGTDKQRPSSESFVFKGQPKAGNKPVYAKVIGSQTTMVGLSPTASMQGAFKLEGDPVSVIVYDSDWNGFYGNASQYSGDTIVCSSRKKVAYSAVSQLLSLGDGRYYTAKATDDNAKLILTRDESPLGTLSVANANLQNLEISCAKGSFYPTLVNGEASVPATDYTLSYATVDIKSNDGKTYMVNFASNAKTTFNVKADSKTELSLGNDVKLTLTVANAGPAKSFDVSLSDKNGFKVSGLYEKSSNNFKQPKAPEVVIYGPDGSVADKRAFEYG